MITAQANAPLPRWAYISLAAIAGVIGLASSAVTAKFFVLGLERVESDALARELLIATGVLMIATELVAFGMAALLPRRKLRSLRLKLIICGAMLLSFEAATIYMTQVALMQTTEASVTASANRAHDLRVSIDQRRLAAKSLRDNGALQSNSSNAWTRTLGAAALRDALKVEREVEPLSTELARLQSTAQPSMAAILGHNGMLAYSVARALLISAMGLIMFAAAGALLREAGGSGIRTVEPQTATDMRPGGGVSLTVSSVRYTIASLAAPGSASLAIAPKVACEATQPPLASFYSKVDLDTPGRTEVERVSLESQTGREAARVVPPTDFKKKRGVMSRLIAEGWCRKVPETLSWRMNNILMHKA